MKPQDSYLLAQYIGLLLGEPAEPQSLVMEAPPSYLPQDALPLAELANRFGLSKTGVIRSHTTLADAGLIRDPDRRPPGFGPWVDILSAGEWFGYGIRYAEPARKVGFGFGLPTGFNCPLVKTEMVPPSPPLCIAGAAAAGTNSEQEGILINPFDKRIASGIPLSPGSYMLLAAIDAIRIGKPRELMYARGLLNELLSRARTIQDRIHREYKEYRAS